jgi:hypothetical protein
MSQPVPSSTGRHSRRSVTLSSGPVAWFVGGLGLLLLTHVCVVPPLRRLIEFFLQP